VIPNNQKKPKPHERNNSNLQKRKTLDVKVLKMPTPTIRRKSRKIKK
jgi:hypothetical protein